MKRIFSHHQHVLKMFVLFGMLGLVSVILIACQTEAEPESTEYGETEELLEKNWSDIESLAEGTEVNIFMWGGDEGINRYIDEWVAPYVHEEYGITIRRTPMNTEDIIQKLMTEKQAGNAEGTVDVMWINGENFKNSKEHDLLWGAFAEGIPNYQAYIDTNDPEVLNDFGTPVDGLEVPWGKAQFVYVYDSERVTDVPHSLVDLKTWVKENPAKFTYPHPKDFTGNTFLRHWLYDALGGPGILLERGFDEEYVEEHARQMWASLHEMAPFLWRKGETYPETLTQLDQLYSQGDVWMTMGYNEARVESLIENGSFPSSSRTFIMEPGSIGNMHYLSVPFNSPNPAGAMVAINALLSPEAQLAKLDPDMWGESMALDPARLGNEHRADLEAIDRGSSVLPADVLQDALLPEVDGAYVEWLRETWLREIIHR